MINTLRYVWVSLALVAGTAGAQTAPVNAPNPLAAPVAPSAAAPGAAQTAVPVVAPPASGATPNAASNPTPPTFASQMQAIQGQPGGQAMVAPQALAPEQYPNQYPGTTPAPGTGPAVQAQPVAQMPGQAPAGQYPNYPSGAPQAQMPQAQMPQAQMPQMPSAQMPGQVRAPTQLPPLPPTVSGQFNTVMDDYFGIEPNQIRQARRIIDDRQKAAADLPNPAKPVTGSISVSLTPGSVPPPVRTFMNMVSSFIVVDSSGAPWPVENFRVGDAEMFQVYRLDEAQGSSFTIETKKPYGQSNLVLKLKGVPTPVVVNLVAGQSVFDSRVEVRVQSRGPNAKAITGATLPAGTDARLLPILDGVAPAGGVRLQASGADGIMAWMMPNGRMIVRTPMPIVEPATTEFVSSSDGTYVYTFMPTPRLLGRTNGQFVDINIGGW